MLDLTWIGWLAGALALAAVVAAVAIPPAVAIPVALGAAAGGLTGPPPPTAAFLPTGLTAAATGFTAFAAPATGAFPPPLGLPPGLVEVLANLPLTNRRYSSYGPEGHSEGDDRCVPPPPPLTPPPPADPARVLRRGGSPPRLVLSRPATSCSCPPSTSSRSLHVRCLVLDVLPLLSVASVLVLRSWFRAALYSFLQP